jgi:G2/mitotic-specific cyclin 3/4
MAHKFENGVEEKLSDLEYMCNEKYTTDQIARAERFILRTLDYRLAWPGPLPFLERISKASQESSLTKKVAEYILEATTVNYACVLKLPSLIAATAFFLAQSLLGNCNWVGISIIYKHAELMLGRHPSRKNTQGINILNYTLT